VKKILKFIASGLVWLYFQYKMQLEKKKLKERKEKIKEDRRIKEAIQRGDAKEVARIIKYYREYAKD
jgi:DNA-binding FadR family transcriptional regulator